MIQKETLDKLEETARYAAFGGSPYSRIECHAGDMLALITAARELESVKAELKEMRALELSGYLYRGCSFDAAKEKA